MNPLTFTPEQREDIRARIANREGAKSIARSYHASPNTIIRMVKRYELGPWRTPTSVPQTPIPDDFLQVAPGKTLTQIAAHYGISRSTAGRMQERAGVVPNVPTKVRAKVALKAAKPAQFVRNYSAAPVDRPQRDMSPAGLAQEILQRDRWTVFRCNAEGRADVAGRFWLCGRVICTDAELIERADRAARRMAA